MPIFYIFDLQKSYYQNLIRQHYKSHYQSHQASRVYNIMSRPVEISQFYGVQVSEYNIQPLRNKDLIQTNSNVYVKNAHIYAFASQQGTNAPSKARIERTINKNTIGQDLTVHRRNRMFREYYGDPYQWVFKKEKKVQPKVRAMPSKTQVKPLQVHSPEQIVMKAARQAYARSIIENRQKIVKKQVRQPSEQQLKRIRHQQKRRYQRTLIVKAYKYELFCIFGRIIFTCGWKIGREELKERLQLPAESFGIQFMRGILRVSEAKARLGREIFWLKRQAYIKQRRERAKIWKSLRGRELNNYVPHFKIEYPHKQQAIYEQKRMHVIKQKACKEEGERMQRVKKQKLKKQKVWYRQTDQPNSKQIKRSIDESAIQYQESEDENQEEYEEIDVLAQNTEKDSQITEQ